MSKIMKDNGVKLLAAVMVLVMAFAGVAFICSEDSSDAGITIPDGIDSVKGSDLTSKEITGISSVDNSGDIKEINLEKDIFLSERITVSESVKFNLNGHTIYADGVVFDIRTSGLSLTIDGTESNSAITSSGRIIQMWQTHNTTISVNGGYYHSEEFAFLFNSDSSDGNNISFSGTDEGSLVIDSSSVGIWASYGKIDSLSMSYCDVTTKNIAVYLGTVKQVLTINHTNITSTEGTAVEIKAGNVEIESSTLITENSYDVVVECGSSGNGPSSSALVVNNAYIDAANVSSTEVTITDSTIQNKKDGSKPIVINCVKPSTVIVSAPNYDIDDVVFTMGPNAGTITFNDDSPSAVYVSGESSLERALSDTKIDTIYLTKPARNVNGEWIFDDQITLSKQLNVTRNVNIIGVDGVTVAYSGEDISNSGNGSKHLVNIVGDITVNISDVIFDADKTHGVQVYRASGSTGQTTFNNVVIENSEAEGLQVNGANVIANNLDTSNGNAWAGVNVDIGENVKSTASFTGDSACKGYVDTDNAKENLGKKVFIYYGKVSFTYTATTRADSKSVDKGVFFNTLTETLKYYGDVSSLCTGISLSDITVKRYAIEADITIPAAFTMTGELEIPKGKTVNLANGSQVKDFTFIGPNGEKMSGSFKSTYSEGTKIIGGSLIINGSIITNTTTEDGIDIVFDGDNILISGTVGAGTVIQVTDGTNVTVPKNETLNIANDAIISVEGESSFVNEGKVIIPVASNPSYSAGKIITSDASQVVPGNMVESDATNANPVYPEYEEGAKVTLDDGLVYTVYIYQTKSTRIQYGLSCGDITYTGNKITEMDISLSYASFTSGYTFSGQRFDLRTIDSVEFPDGEKKAEYKDAGTYPGAIRVQLTFTKAGMAGTTVNKDIDLNVNAKNLGMTVTVPTGTIAVTETDVRTISEFQSIAATITGTDVNLSGTIGYYNLNGVTGGYYLVLNLGATGVVKDEKAATIDFNKNEKVKLVDGHYYIELGDNVADAKSLLNSLKITVEHETKNYKSATYSVKFTEEGLKFVEPLDMSLISGDVLDTNTTTLHKTGLKVNEGDDATEFVVTGGLLWKNSFTGYSNVDWQKRGWYLAIQFNGMTAEKGYKADLKNNTIEKKDMAIDGQFVFRYNGADEITVIVKDKLGLRTEYTIDISAVELQTYSEYIENKGNVAAALTTQGISVPEGTAFGDATIIVISNDKVGRTVGAVSTNNGYAFNAFTSMETPEEDKSGLWVRYISLVADEETASYAVAGPYNIVINDKDINTVTKTGIYTVGSGYETDAENAKNEIGKLGITVNDTIDQTFYYVYQVYGTYGQVKASMIRNADEGNIILPAYDNYTITEENIGSKHIFYYSFLDNQLIDDLEPIGGPYVMRLTLGTYFVSANIEVNADTVAVFEKSANAGDYIDNDYSITQSNRTVTAGGTLKFIEGSKYMLPVKITGQGIDLKSIEIKIGSEVLISTISEDGNYLIPLDNGFTGTISVDVCGDKQYYRTVTYTIDCTALKYEQKTYPVIYDDYREKHEGTTAAIGGNVTLPTIDYDDFVGWSVNGTPISKDTTSVTILDSYVNDDGKIVFVAEYDHIGTIIGAGFYEDSEDAKLAMAAFGSTYSGGVDDRTMFIIWEQSGLVGKTVEGFLYYEKNFEDYVFNQPMKNEDGVRTWLFSDLNELKEKKFQGGTYTIVIKVDGEKFLTKEIEVALNPAVAEYTIVFDADLGQINMSPMTGLVDGQTITLPGMPTDVNKKYAYYTWSINGNIIGAQYTVSYKDADENNVITITAKGTPIIEKQVYTLTIEGKDSKSYTEGTWVPVPLYTGDVDENKKFVGYTVKGVDYVAYPAGSAIQMNSDIDLIPVFDYKVYESRQIGDYKLYVENTNGNEYAVYILTNKIDGYKNILNLGTVRVNASEVHNIVFSEVIGKKTVEGETYGVIWSGTVSSSFPYIQVDLVVLFGNEYVPVDSMTVSTLFNDDFNNGNPMSAEFIPEPAGATEENNYPWFQINYERLSPMTSLTLFIDDQKVTNVVWVDDSGKPIDQPTTIPAKEAFFQLSYSDDEIDEGEHKFTIYGSYKTEYGTVFDKIEMTITVPAPDVSA